MKTSAEMIAIAVVMSGCATAQKDLSPVYRPTYEYTPPATAPTATNGASLTVALVAPEWPGIDEWWEPIAQEFARNMSLDFEEMLTARGFTVRGPFRTHDDMVYEDKAQSSLMITPRLDVTTTVGDLSVESGTRLNLLGPNQDFYTITSGSVTLGGRVTLVVSEPFTGEKLWTPSIELEKRTSSFAGELEYDSRPSSPFGEPQFQSAVNRSLEDMYAVIMKECWERLVPGELSVYEAQAAAIREKAGYVVPSRD